jgi:hypothetical protein
MPSEPKRGRGPRGDAAADAGADPLVTSFVNRTMAPFVAALPPEDQAELREILELVFETHPNVAPVLDRLRRRRPPTRSGARSKGGGDGT